MVATGISVKKGQVHLNINMPLMLIYINIYYRLEDIILRYILQDYDVHGM